MISGKDIAVFIGGIVLGLFLFYQFFQPEIETVYKETIKTDTVFISVKDTIRITKTEIKHNYLRDTILIDPIEPKIKSFSASKAFLYGNASVSGEVLGEVLKMDIYTDFKIPQITNTITKETISTIAPSGLYVTGGFSASDKISPVVGGTYLKNKSLVFYNYNVTLKSHTAGIGIKVF